MAQPQSMSHADFADFAEVDAANHRSRYAAVAPTKISITLSASDHDEYARRAFDAPEALYLR